MKTYWHVWEDHEYGTLHSVGMNRSDVVHTSRVLSFPKSNLEKLSYEEVVDMLNSAEDVSLKGMVNSLEILESGGPILFKS